VQPEHPEQLLRLNMSRKNPLNSAVFGAVLIADIKTRLYIESAPLEKMGGLRALHNEDKGHL
jgi:hypothetical protein